MERVLIVDDSLTVRMDLLELFEHAGWSPTPCATLAEARAALAAEAFDLVVLDVLLPDGDGIELLREIRRSPRSRAWPVMVLSGEDEVVDRLRGLEMGADEYVGKPYDRDYVIACAARYLHGIRQPQDAPTVLLVDDSPTYLETMRAAFTGAGFRVAAAATGEDGLRVASTQSIDAAVVDLHLPGIDGVALIRRLRADRGLQLVPCMLLTGSELRTDELMGLEAGADAYLAKVHDPEVIVARLSALLRSVGARPEVGFDPVGPKKILAVDDSVTYLHALGERLRHEGYGVVMAHSGAEAMAVLGAETVDLVLLDVIMPGLSGIEVCRRLKANAAWQDVPVILLTARDERDAMLEGLNAGADDYVVKGTDFDVLTGRVRAHLRRKHLQDENRRIHERLHRMHAEAQEERAARELAETRAALMEDLKAKNAELVQARARSEQESRYKSQFLASISHELRTPQNSIIGFSELLEQELFGPLNARQARYVKNVLDSGRHLLSLVNDILDLSK
ncbi:MAG: response regulator, partial [Myxococcales bacterium]|nr:response regulator [Myxococcales bacterium]